MLANYFSEYFINYYSQYTGITLTNDYFSPTQLEQMLQRTIDKSKEMQYNSLLNYSEEDLMSEL